MSKNHKTRIIKELKEKLMKNQGETIQSLAMILDIESKKELFNEVILLGSRYRKNEKSIKKGILDYDNYSIEFNKINDSLLSIIDEIDENVAMIYSIKNSVFNFISVICRDKNRIKEMEELFPPNKYDNIKFYEASDFLFEPIKTEKKDNQHTKQNIELIIYDNFPKSTAKSSIPPRLSEILADDTIKAKILFYSPKEARELQREEYLKRVYFSNSPFSIHARIDEMLLYLKNKK